MRNNKLIPLLSRPSRHRLSFKLHRPRSNNRVNNVPSAKAKRGQSRFRFSFFDIE